MTAEAADKILDLAWREAYLTLPARIQQALEAGNPHAEKRLIAAYQKIKTGAPNRATRRRITARVNTSTGRVPARKGT